MLALPSIIPLFSMSIQPSIRPVSTSRENAIGQDDPPSSGRHGLRWALIVAGVLVIGYAAFLRPSLRSAANARGGVRPVIVSAEQVRQADLDVRIVALGTVTPVSTVTVHSRVDGELQKILFKEGQTVEAGAPLVEIDPRPFQVQKQQVEAQLARDTALLENARLDVVRFRTLLGQDSVAKQQLDTQEALVRQDEATVKLDQAQIDNASLQLAYAHVAAPISGRVGLRLVDLGNIVHASDPGGIVVITQLHPITVLFSIPQTVLPLVMQQFKADAAMVVEAYDRDGRTLLATGKLATVDNQIDPTTGTVKLRAEFPNLDETLFPNQFVNVSLIVEKLHGATVIPSGTVQRGTAGTFVYVVVDQKTVSVRAVETGPTDRGMVAIMRGLAPGEAVVVDGVDKLREGAAVEVVARSSKGASGADAASAPAKREGKRQPEGVQPSKN
jgi:multidrug efflux system membrane fusion protein